MTEQIIIEELSTLDILKIDLFIFEMLKNEFENKNLDFINIKQLLEDRFPNGLPYQLEIIEKRIFWAIGIGLIDLEILPDDINEFIKLMDEREINPQDYIYTKGKKHFVDHQKYYQNHLNIKINAEGLRHIDEIIEQIKQEKKNRFLVYRVLNKINCYTEEFMRYKKTIGIILTILIAIVGSLFGPRIMNKLENMSFMTSILNFMEVNTGKDKTNNGSYVNININTNRQKNDELRDRINDFIKNNFRKNEIINLEIKDISDDQKNFRIYLKNNIVKSYHITRDKDGKVEIKPIEENRNFLEIKNGIQNIKEGILKF